MTLRVLRDVRFWLLLAATVLTVIAIVAPRMRLVRPALDVLAVVDITGSMNTRDMGQAGKAQSRLEAVRATLRSLLASLPCESRFGLGIFTERSSFLLFEPAEVCANYDALDGSIRQLDWRMAWAADSYVARGLHRAIEIASSTGANLAFFTDGHEAPPLPASGLPTFEGKTGDVRGLVVGVGGREKSPIPKFDHDGREIGTWGPQDVPQENRSGPPPADASSRPGYHPRYAPFGASVAEGDEHLSSVREVHLKTLAQQTGLSYVNLAETRDLAPALQAAGRSRPVEMAADISSYPATAALLLLVVLTALLPGVERTRAWIRAPH